MSDGQGGGSGRDSNTQAQKSSGIKSQVGTTEPHANILSGQGIFEVTELAILGEEFAEFIHQARRDPSLTPTAINRLENRLLETTKTFLHELRVGHRQFVLYQRRVRELSAIIAGLLFLTKPPPEGDE